MTVAAISNGMVVCSRCGSKIAFTGDLRLCMACEISRVAGVNPRDRMFGSDRGKRRALFDQKRVHESERKQEQAALQQNAIRIMEGD
jgi:hypothetical protein